MTGSTLMLDDPAVREALRGLAERAARAGGGVAHAAFGRPHDIEIKADGSEVTKTDLAAERAVIDTIRSERPEDAFIGEELLADHGNPVTPAHEVVWVIDPIDGTRNYIRRVPFYACSVAALQNGIPIVGAVYDPAHDQMYAADTETTFVNGRPWRLPDDRRAHGAARAKPLVAVPSIYEPKAVGVLEHWKGRTVMRDLGAAALHLALVASGGLDGCLMTTVKIWDVAAGWLLVRSAGGFVQGVEQPQVFPRDLVAYQGEPTPLLATTPHARDALIPTE